MANGKTHEKIHLFLLAATLTFVISYLNRDLSLESIFIILGYLLGTYFLSPDLDLKSKPYRRWWIFRFIWIPYQTFKHRSIWTHGFIISDIIRYAYLITCYVVFSYLFSLISDFSFTTITSHSKQFISDYKLYLFFLFIGNIISTFSHTSTDKISTFNKKYKRKHKTFSKKK